MTLAMVDKIRIRGKIHLSDCFITLEDYLQIK